MCDLVTFLYSLNNNDTNNNTKKTLLGRPYEHARIDMPDVYIVYVNDSSAACLFV